MVGGVCSAVLMRWGCWVFLFYFLLVGGCWGVWGVEVGFNFGSLGCFNF